MLLDKQNMFSEAQAITTGSANSTNTIDLGVAGSPIIGGTAIQDPGRGQEIQVFAQVVTAFTSGGSGTLTVKLVQSAAAGLTSPTILAQTDAIPVATLAAGYQFRLSGIPAGVTQRYLGLIYTVATADMTAGAVTAGLVLDRQTNPYV